MQDHTRHVIRLWGPWQVQASPSDTQMDSWEGRVNLKNGVSVDRPWESSFGSAFEGELTLLRRFNRPTGLDARSKMTLEVDLVTDQFLGKVRLNGSAELGQLRRGLQTLELPPLDPANRVELVFDVPSGALIQFPMPPFCSLQLCISEENA